MTLYFCFFKCASNNLTISFKVQSRLSQNKLTLKRGHFVAVLFCLKLSVIPHDLHQQDIQKVEKGVKM